MCICQVLTGVFLDCFDFSVRIVNRNEFKNAQEIVCNTSSIFVASRMAESLLPV